MRDLRCTVPIPKLNQKPGQPRVTPLQQKKINVVSNSQQLKLVA